MGEDPAERTRRGDTADESGVSFVFDSTPLIHLVKAGHQRMIKKLEGEKYLPPSVYEEVVEVGKEKGFNDALVTKELVERKVLKVKEPPKEILNRIMLHQDIHPRNHPQSSNQSRVSQIINSLDREEINNFLDWGEEVGQIAEFHRLDVLTVWATLLEGEGDEQRFREFGREEYGNHLPHRGPSNYWEFERRDPRLGRQDEIPGQVLMNLLHRHTSRGDLVVDPMASGGVTGDACLVMGRECRAYDPEPERGEISELDVESEGLPKPAEDCDLLLLNPLSELDKIGGERWRDLGAMAEDRFGRPEEFRGYMKGLAEESFDALEEGDRVALTTWRNVRGWGGCPGLISTRAFREAGFELIERVTFPLTDEILEALKENWSEWAIENKCLLNVLVDLLVFRKSGWESANKGKGI
ncbi:hypothetical protein AKJ65_01480 [candidate division MSBL1 archaeon SCGC-AAA259E19]|uniref:DNA methylase N-4/N-6 domain-containing protein n=1 Tax=candidate division MSBL1 archaeon SCGC-AAA259E19 TaxID=1698264 RepID=A0A133UMT7_9EURY|nr:hypothetical protein AKJ65_01480 [candidate division MSBL1 archaeon SCGC-AAA259E19]